MSSTVTIPPKSLWLFSAPVDIGVFLGSALISLVALWLGAQVGALKADTPDWAWIPAVLLVDVAHVYSTGFRVYLDSKELKRHPWLYSLVPICGLAIGILLYAQGELVFWRALAYLAVFHFVRQQYGWVALYRARAGESDRLGYGIDTLAIYAATLYPLIYWHTHLPRHFWWFLTADFISIPSTVNRFVAPLYWLIMLTYLSKSLYKAIFYRQINPGKDIVVITTAFCWYLGIITYNSDYAFTVTNVIIHGIPYMALIYWYGQQRYRQQAAHPGIFRIFAKGPWAFLGILWVLAYLEELVWDRGVWQERSWFFGHPWPVGSWKLILVPLLALPQLTHYFLDGFIWRRKRNPDLKLINSD